MTVMVSLLGSTTKLLLGSTTNLLLGSTTNLNRVLVSSVSTLGSTAHLALSVNIEYLHEILGSKPVNRIG